MKNFPGVKELKWAKYEEVVRSHLQNIHQAFNKPQNKEQLSCIQPRGHQKIKS